MKVYKGEQPFREFLELEAQGCIFDAPIESSSERARIKLTELARTVLEEMPTELLSDVKEVMKTRAAGKIPYNADAIGKALDVAMRTRVYLPPQRPRRFR